MENNSYLTLTPKKYIKQIVAKLFSISNYIKIKRSSQNKFHVQLDIIRNCKKKEEEAFLVAKNRGLQLNQAKILRIYPIV